MRERFYGVQGLRFAAATAVVAAHAVDLAGTRLGLETVLSGGTLEDFGAVGVDVFFVISGFIIATTTSGQAGVQAAGEFLWRRFRRVAPIYWLLSTPILIGMARGGTLTPDVAAATFLFWPFSGLEMTFPALGPGWNLCFEMLFYAGFGLAMAGGKRVGWGLVCAYAAMLVAGLAAAAPVLRFWGAPIILEFLLGVGIASVWPRAPRQLGLWAVSAGGGRDALWRTQRDVRGAGVGLVEVRRASADRARRRRSEADGRDDGRRGAGGPPAGDRAGPEVRRGGLDHKADRGRAAEAGHAGSGAGAMRDHESALQKAVLAALKGYAAVQALLGGRVWDFAALGAPEGAECPHLVIGRCESRPVAADGGGVEQRLTLTGVSQFAGSEEAKAVAAAVRACLHEAVLEADGVRTATLRATFADVFRAGDRRRTYAVVRLRAVTEEI
jgi:hypothetical protein